MHSFDNYQRYLSHRSNGLQPLTSYRIKETVQGSIFNANGHPMYYVNGHIVSVKRDINKSPVSFSICNKTESVECTVIGHYRYISIWRPDHPMEQKILPHTKESVLIGSRLYGITENKVYECMISGSDTISDVPYHTIVANSAVPEGVLLFDVFGMAVGFSVPRTVHKSVVLPIDIVIDFVRDRVLPSTLGLKYQVVYKKLKDRISPTYIIKTSIYSPTIEGRTLISVKNNGTSIDIEKIRFISQGTIITINTIDDKGIISSSEITSTVFSPYVEDVGLYKRSD